jgi:hypothetical protein
MDNQGNVTYYAGSDPGTQHGTVSPQTWEVTGEPGYAYNFYGPTITAYGSNWPATMTFYPTPLGGANPFVLNANGKCFLSQGGTLIVGPGTPSGGPYTASWEETVAYN